MGPKGPYMNYTYSVEVLGWGINPDILFVREHNYYMG